MYKYIRFVATFSVFIGLLTPANSAERGVFDLERWDNILINISDAAKQKNIKQTVINDVVKDSVFIPNVVKADQRQLEFTLTLDEYLHRTINDNRIATGKKMFSVYPTLLSKVNKKYNIPSNVILAFWGMESNYGKVKSVYQLSNSFLSLIYEGRREKFFTNQLLALMETASKNNLKIKNIHGSWAGAMGHFQFIPTTLLQYGVDGNNDGRIDIINSIGDAMYSAANYLNKLGWQANEPITKQVLVPYNFDRNLLNGDI
ncbi:MAG: lytic murein transglycosylase, partial [Alphaproteobacteria bacterium]|nr:lytic murein transglycosylase [Alphaproteobacteria bacterium]